MANLFQTRIINFLLQSVLSFSFIRDIFFPHNPILHKTRNWNETVDGGEQGVLDFIALVESKGYPAEEHYITTEDGYQLVIHRVPGSPKSPPFKGKPVVLLQHGLFGSSDIWVILGPGKSLALLLADQGFDVWVGNIRGNTYCRSHEELSISDPEFWDFSFHEIGFYDTASFIDYVLDTTSQKKVYFIAYSMGTTLNYVLLSTRPSYNKKIKLAVSLAPVAMWKVPPKTLAYVILRRKAEILKMFFERNDIYDLLPQTDVGGKLLNRICTKNIITRFICSTIVSSFVGSNPDQLNQSVVPSIVYHFPAGASVQTLYHYAQNMRDGRFQLYDYGTEENLEVYEMKKPPLYDLKKITTPFVLIYSDKDPLSNSENIKSLANKLSEVKIQKVSHNKFSHLDFIWARDVKELVFDRVIKILLAF